MHKKVAIIFKRKPFVFFVFSVSDSTKILKYRKSKVINMTFKLSK